jgi:hypothetical protein
MMEATLPPEDRDDVPEEELPQKPPIEPPDDDYDGDEEDVPEELFHSDEEAEEDPTIDNQENDSA